ncbi:MAG: hypothetical protein P4L45_15555 [Ignavibacteriaceae bacterium]|nr:hypothetical protein [Ignavibacteriaceae bacterium]
MNRIHIIFSVVLFFVLGSSCFAQHLEKTDSVYIIEVKVPHREGDCPIFYLLYKKDSVTYIAFSYDYKDWDRELDYVGDFKNNEGIEYKLYGLYEEAVGTWWSILFDKSNEEFFLTDRYDLSASGDSLITGQVYFKTKTAIIKNVSKGGTYSVKLHKLNLTQNKKKSFKMVQQIMRMTY